MEVPIRKKRRGPKLKEIKFGSYLKPCKNGGWMKRRVIAVYPGHVKYLQDTQERPNVTFNSSRRAFVAWMRQATLEVVN